MRDTHSHQVREFRVLALSRMHSNYVPLSSLIFLIPYFTNMMEKSNTWNQIFPLGINQAQHIMSTADVWLVQLYPCPGVFSDQA
jgi:hypothetical protein